MEIRIKKFKKGFSMGEVMLAVFVLSIALVGTVDLMIKSTKESIDNRDNVIATELAQEGVELVRNIRDNNWVSGTGISGFSGFPSGDRNNCRIDKSSSDISDAKCSDSLSKVLNYNANFYVHSGGTATRFQRVIMLDNMSADEWNIYSIVTWGGAYNGSGWANLNSNCRMSNKCAYAQLNLTDWGKK